MSLSSILEIIDRSIFEALNVVAVSNGLAVDREVIPLDDPDIWKAAEQSIIADKGFVVDIFGSSNSHEKGTRQTPRISYIPERLLPGEIGGPITPKYSEQPTSYKKQTYPGQTSNYLFGIDIQAANATQWRVLHAIVAEAIPNRGYIPLYDSTIILDDIQTDRFLVNQYGYSDISDNLKGIMAGKYQFMAVDLFESDFTESTQVIAPISNLKVETEFDEIELSSSSVLRNEFQILILTPEGDSVTLPAVTTYNGSVIDNSINAEVQVIHRGLNYTGVVDTGTNTITFEILDDPNGPDTPPGVITITLEIALSNFTFTLNMSESFAGLTFALVDPNPGTP